MINMTPLDVCRRTLENTQQVINRVTPEDLVKPTPCSDWDVRALVNHMVGVLGALEAPARGEQVDFSATGSEDVIGSDPAGTFSKNASEFMAAWSAPGAIERVVTSMFGEQPSAFYLGLATADILLHGWDLASAIGAPSTMDETTSAEVLANMQRILKPEMRGEGKAFASEATCASDASVQERLVAFSGRSSR